MAVTAELVPRRNQHIEHRRPSLFGDGMVGFIAVARLIGDPAERTAIGHPHRHRPARLRHAGRKQQRRCKNLLQCGDQRHLRAAVKIAGVKPQTCSTLEPRRAVVSSAVLPAGIIVFYHSAAYRAPLSLLLPQAGIVAQPGLSGKTPIEDL